MVKLRSPPSTVLDGQLFLVRHLLILKDVTQNLDLVQRDAHHTIDFAGVTGTYFGLPSALYLDHAMN